MGLLLLVAATAAAWADLRAPELKVEAPMSLQPLAQRLRAADPARLESSMHLVGLEDPGSPIQVVLAPEGSELARVAPPWISGYAIGTMGSIVLLPARLPSYPDSSLEELLHHEVAHVLIARAAGGRRVPRWFNEGVAMIAGSSWGLADRSQMTLAMLRGRRVSFADIDRAFAGGRVVVTSAYAISGAFVRDLLRRHGSDVAGRILAGVAQGLAFDEAFQRATGTTLAHAEASFWRRQTLWYRWVPVLTSSVTLWIGITFLALVAIKRRRQRDAALMKTWEEEERSLEVDDDDDPVN
jgi:hypothetical protein